MDDFFPIEMEEFVASKDLKMELYLRVDEKFIKIAHAGEDIDQQRLSQYRKNKAQYLFVSRPDYEKYLAFHLKLATAVTKSKAVPEEKRLQLVKHANDVVLTKVFTQGMDEKAFSQARAITDVNLSVLSSKPDIHAALQQLTAGAEWLFAHALGVSVYATMMAPGLNCTTATTLSKISLGGMLHDIALKDVPEELLQRPQENWSDEDRQLYQQHPLLGLQMLQGLEGMPREVLVILAQHHESRDGLGFPAALPASQISPLAKMVTVADEFAELVLKYPGRDVHTPAQAIEFLLASRLHVLDVKMVESLALVVGVDPAKIQVTSSSSG